MTPRPDSPDTPDTSDVERLLRESTHAYADTFEPAPDSWAQLRGRANEVEPQRWFRRNSFGVGGFLLAAAAIAAVVVAAVSIGDDDSRNVEVTNTPDSTTTTVAEDVDPGGPLDLVATFTGTTPVESGVTVDGTAGFSREPGTSTWTATLDVSTTGSYVAPITLEVVTPASDGLQHSVDVCEATPAADGVTRCTGTFSGARSDQWAAFGPGEAVFLTDSAGTVGRRVITFAPAEEVASSTTTPDTTPPTTPATTPQTTPQTTPPTTPQTAPPAATTTVPPPLVLPEGDLTARFVPGGGGFSQYGINVDGGAGFVVQGDGSTWTGTVRGTVTGPYSGPIHLMIGRPFSDGSVGTHFGNVCTATPDATGRFECSATFSGAANEFAGPYGAGSSVYLGDSTGGGVRTLYVATAG